MTQYPLLLVEKHNICIYIIERDESQTCYDMSIIIISFCPKEKRLATSVFLLVESIAITHYKETQGRTHAVHAEGVTFDT